MRPIRLKLSRSARFNLQEASRAINGLPAKSCARPHLMGNPFGWQTPQLSDHNGRKLAVRQHREWLDDGKVPASRRADRAELLALREKVLAALPLYAGHNLGCFCGKDQLCHVDTLIDRANR